MQAKSAGKGIANFAEAEPRASEAGQNIAARGFPRLCVKAMCGKETSLLTSILFLLCFKRKRAPRPAAPTDI
jgi:hypothetical protein